MDLTSGGGAGRMKIVIFGLSITSSWGNGHATTYRGLVRELARRGHQVHFIERDVPWYAENRDLHEISGVRISLYRGLDDLSRYTEEVRAADAVIVGSYVPDGIVVGEWVLAKAGGVTAFYDIDTPVTLAKLSEGNAGYISAALIPRYQVYLSFTGGPTLTRLEKEWGSPAARPLYCSVDPAEYYPEARDPRWDLGYLGTYSPDRQPGLECLMLEPAAHMPARKFVVAGSQYPEGITWPSNVERIEHLPPAAHRRFYNRQRFTLNLTRADMIAAGYSPSIRLFEAAACGTPIITDEWTGLGEFFTPGREILIARTGYDVEHLMWALSDEEAERIGQAARARVLGHHTSAHRAAELEGYLNEAANASVPVSFPDSLTLQS
jgi:spore maturation protein CgeB